MNRGRILESCSVLDVGCGVGGVMKGLKENGVTDLIGVTISSRQVELAKQLDPDLDIVLSDFMQWEDKGRKCDRIILCESFYIFLR